MLRLILFLNDVSPPLYRHGDPRVLRYCSPSRTLWHRSLCSRCSSEGRAPPYGGGCHCLGFVLPMAWVAAGYACLSVLSAAPVPCSWSAVCWCTIELGVLVSIGLVVLIFASFLHCSIEFCFALPFLLVPIFFVVPFNNAKLVGSSYIARLYKWQQADGQPWKNLPFSV